MAAGVLIRSLRADSLRIVLLIVLLWAGSGFAAHATAADADFYRGRTVTVVVGHTAGGGYDLYARLLAKHLGSHLLDLHPKTAA